MTEQAASYPWPWDGILARLLLREGSTYTDHPADKGGPTRHGITLDTLSDYRGLPCSAGDVQALTAAGACAIYWQKWVCHPSLRLDLLAEGNPPLLVEVALDTSVLFGRRRAALWLQEAINQRRPSSVAVDGVLGPATRTALQLVDPSAIARLIVAYRIKRHAQRVVEDRTQLAFLKGWIARSCLFLELPG